MTSFDGSAAWNEFLNGIKTEATRKQYVSRLTHFFGTIGLTPDEFAVKAEKDPKWAGQVIIGYIAQVKRRVDSGTLKTVSLPGYVTPIKFFCDMNDIMTVNWRKVWRTVPKASGARDRPPTADEIRGVLKDCDKRSRVAVLVMASGGVRVGAFSFPTAGGKERPMLLKDFEPLDKDGNRVKEREKTAAVRLTVYPGERGEEYTTFITPETWGEIQDYLGDRRRRGETVGPDSPILRDKYLSVRSPPHFGAASDPRPLKAESIKTMIRDLIEKSGVRPKIENGERLYEWKEAHGFRKFFENVTQRHMKYAAAHILAGHISALNNKGAYDSWNETELLKDYLKAVPELTIFADNKPLAKMEDLEKFKAELRDEIAVVNRANGMIIEMGKRNAEERNEYQELVKSQWEELKRLVESEPEAKAAIREGIAELEAEHVIQDAQQAKIENTLASKGIKYERSGLLEDARTTEIGEALKRLLKEVSKS